jgi:DHA1 family multidrug resistance protein-like MFS transporter
MRFSFRNGNEKFFLILCVIGAFAILSSTMSKNPVLKPFATSLGTPTDLLGFIAAASTIPGMLVSLPAASLSDIVGRRKVLLFGAFVFASAPFLYLFVSVWWQLFLVRFFHGFATGVFVPVAEATVAERFPTKRGERISIFSSATAVGRALAPFLGGSILFLTNYGYSTLYLAVGIAGVTTFILTFLLFVEKKTPPTTSTATTQQPKMFHGWLTVAKNRRAVAVSFIQATQYYVFGAVEFFLVGYLTDIAKIDALTIGVIMGSQIVALIIARPIFGRVSDRVGRQAPIIFGSISSIVFVSAFPFSTQTPILLLLSIGYGISFATVISSTAPLISELVPRELVGTSLGFLATTMDMGQTLGPIISGFVLALTLQYSALFFSLGLITAASILVLLLLTRSNIAKNKSA